MRKVLLCASLACLPCYMLAASLTPDEALDAALGNSVLRKSVSDEAVSAYQLEWTGKNSGVYVFGHRDGGFVIASGDDTLPALLGFSSNGKFDPMSMPPALEAFLQQLDSSVAAGKVNIRYQSAPKEEIKPLITTQWNQAAPFNDLCPEYRGERTLTGCVATATAQVLKYWEYPADPVGEVNYKWQDGGKQLTYDFSEVKFDWADMSDVYDENSTPEQKEAVAQIMLACGMASQMQYSTTFSGTTDVDAALGLIKHFKYDSGVKLLYRDFYRIAEWNDIIYQELEAKRPVLYYGFSPAGGHAFVCDGYLYNNDEYFHINWGWGGLSDGYFLLSVLDPEYLGLGGSAGGFNIMQSALVGLKPAGDEPSDYYKQILWFGYFGIGNFSYAPGESIMFGSAGGLMRGGLYNMSLVDADVKVGVQLTPEQGGDPVYFKAESAYTMPSTAVLETFKVPSADFPLGTFIVKPAYCYVDEDQWRVAPEEVAMHTLMKMTVTETEITFDIVDDSDGVFLTGFAVDSPVLVNGKPFVIEVSAHAYNTDEPVKITPVITDQSGMLIAQGETWAFRPAAGEDYEHKWDSAFPEIPLGAYKLAVIDGRMMLLSEPVDIAVVNEDTKTTFQVSNFRINRRSPGSSVTVLNEKSMSVSFRVSLVAGFYDGEVAPWIFDADGKPLCQLADAKELTLFPDQGTNLTFTGSLDELDVTSEYKVGVCAGNGNGTFTQVSSLYGFRFAEAGIEVVSADMLDGGYELFDVNGRKVVSPADGSIVIMRKGDDVRKVIVK